MKLLIVTGGTGGHIYPALALANSAKETYRDVDILFIGNDDRMEATLIPEHGYAFRSLHAAGLTGSAMQKIKAIAFMMKAYTQARKIIDEFQPDVAIGFGGYVSAPVMLAAHHKHIPCMIHEQNSVVGVANRFVSKYMDAIVICYERLFQEFPKEKTRLLGNPRATTAIKVPFDAKYYASLGLDERKPLILIVMGSLGSSSVNAILCDALPKMKKDYQFLFVTGKREYQNVLDTLKPQANIHVVDYVKQLEIMERVDLIICRAGATTAAEITAIGVPSIMIPSPYVAHNHQYYNASVLANAKASFMLEEKDLNAQNLSEKITTVMEHKEVRKQMRERALALGFPHASENIVSWMNEMKR